MNKKYYKIILAALLVSLLAIPFGSVFAAHLDKSSAQADQPPQQAAQDLDSLVRDWTKPIEPAQPSPTPASAEAENAPLDPDKVIYLTFDDGPSPTWTPQILDLLKRYHAVATFFELGNAAATYPETVKALAEGGQTLGNHSYNHSNFTELDYGGFYQQVSSTNWALRNALAGVEGLSDQITPCVRPPYGAVDEKVYSYIAQISFSPAFWTIDTLDWKGISESSILKNVKDGLSYPNKVVLMHDGGENRENTVKGLGLVLHDLSLAGYRFEPLCTKDGQIVYR